jgi:hypothetical protein
MWELDLQLPVHSVPITTKVVNPKLGKNISLIIFYKDLATGLHFMLI